jgi:hypothetical protein
MYMTFQRELGHFNARMQCSSNGSPCRNCFLKMLVKIRKNKVVSEIALQISLLGHTTYMYAYVFVCVYVCMRATDRKRERVRLTLFLQSGA